MTVTLTCTRSEAGRILAFLHEIDASSSYAAHDHAVVGNAVAAVFIPDGHGDLGLLDITTEDPLALLRHIRLDDGTPAAARLDEASFDEEDLLALADAYEQEADRIERNEPGYPSDPALVVQAAMLRQTARLLRGDAQEE